MIEACRLPATAALAGFSADDLAALGAVASARSVAAGCSIWGDDCASRGLGIVISGRVELSRPTEFPERRVVMGIFGPGSVVGETIFFGGTGCSLIALAMEDAEIALFDADSLEKLASSNPEVHSKLLSGVLKVLSRRLNQAYERMSSVF